jgi:ABC-type antimicrobial peptide transport system permease subunit
MMPAVRAAIWSVDREQPVWKTVSMDSLLARHRQPSQSLAVLMALFAIIAVALAGVGLYGVMSYTVAQRTREIGIRMALGASRRRVVGDVVRRALGLTAIALALGLALAAAARALIAGLVWGVGSFDPLAVIVAVAVLLAVSLLAAFVPARRAARVEPTVALAQE